MISTKARVLLGIAMVAEAIVFGQASGFCLAAVRVDVEPSPDTSTDLLALRATGPDTNAVFVRYDGTGYIVTGAMAPITAGPGCLVTDLHAITCVGPIASAELFGSDGDDNFDLTGVPVPVVGSGGRGDDSLNAGVAGSRLYGGPGRDHLTGGSQSDVLRGGPGDDWIEGRGGSDSIFGGAGDDVLQAGNGTQELLIGGPGRDLLEGGAGSDILQGNNGADSLVGGTGNDTLAPGAGADSVVNVTPSDSIECPVDTTGGAATVAACVSLSEGSPPQSWPPQQPQPQNAVTARHRRRWAQPEIAGNASFVAVFWPGKRWTKAERCIRTYSDWHRDPDFLIQTYRARVRIGYEFKVKSPPPLAAAKSARITRQCH
jgi:hypothetical protein